MPPFRPKVDYSLRPAKATARRMIVEALSQLTPLMPVEEYRYVGMGSTYFRDFQLVHRRLGICDMITIEGDPRAEARVRFNLPLACIKVVMKRTGDALPQIGLENRPHIIWLDYESRVDKGVLSDLEEAVVRCASASVLIVTVNADRPPDNERERWLSELGDGRSDPLARAEYAQFSYRVIRQQIRRALGSRNAARPKEEHITFHQVFHMVYSDGAPMLMVGGALVAEADRRQWDECRIGTLEFTRSAEESFRIKIPRLTRREVQHLLSAMPDTRDKVKHAASVAGIPPRDAQEFAAVYRYAPLFVETEDW